MKEARQKETIQERFTGVETNLEHKDELLVDEKQKVIRELALDNEKLMPDRQQRLWLIA